MEEEKDEAEEQGEDSPAHGMFALEKN